MRNRTGPRWFAIAGLLAFIPVVEDTWWVASARCDGNPHPVALLIWYGSLALMLLHHGLQPAAQPAGSPERRIVTILGNTVPVAFLSTLLVSFGVRQFEQFWHGDLRDMPQWVSATKTSLTPPGLCALLRCHRPVGPGPAGRDPADGDQHLPRLSRGLRGAPAGINGVRLQLS